MKVARDAVALAKQKLYDTVIIDTAGRLGVDEELMKQARDIRDAVQPKRTPVRNRRDDRSGCRADGEGVR